MPRSSGPPLTGERVVGAARGLVERDGPRQLTMRRLGEALGVEAMSLYEYVTSKHDLISAIAERLLQLRLDGATAGPWLGRIEAVARAWAALAEAHPRAFPLLYEPRQISPQDLESAELILAALHDGGFDPAASAVAYRAMTCLIDGALLRQTAGLPDVNAAWHDTPGGLDPVTRPHSVAAERYASALRPAEIISAGIRLVRLSTSIPRACR
jgi:AcrR family transcriptional regulator